MEHEKKYVSNTDNGVDYMEQKLTSSGLEKKYVSAIDIGTTKIVAIVGEKERNGRVRILGIGKSPSKGVKRGVVLNIEETSNAIRDAVRSAQEQSGVRFSDVYVGIAGQHIKSVKTRAYRFINNKDYEITQADVDNLLLDAKRMPHEPGEEIVHVIPQNYTVDNEMGVKQPVGMSGKKLEANFHIVIGQVASARNIKKCIDRVGLSLKKLILEPLASSEAVLSDDEKEAGVALVDIGGGTTDVAVYYDNVIRHTAVIPFGGNVVTNDIKEGASLLIRVAEKLKIEHGSAMGDLEPANQYITITGINGRGSKEIASRTLAHIIQARMEEIIDAIDFEIESSGYKGKLGAGLAITGGGSVLRNLPQLMKFQTGLDVRVAYPTDYFASNLTEKVNHPMYATSVGLIMKGFEDSELNNSFSNPNEVEEENPDAQEQEKREKHKGGFLNKLKGFTEQFGQMFNEEDNTM